MIISYNLGDSLYLNLTNKCTNACEFCLRVSKNKEQEPPERWQTSDDLSGSNELWLEREPTVDEVIEDLKSRKLSDYKEIVFCGFGEPFMRFDDCVKIAKWLREQNVKSIRVNTNGQANMVHRRDVTGEMEGLFDVVSISLNNKNAQEYDNVCHSDFGEDAYAGLLDFGSRCAKRGMQVVYSVVDLLPPEDIDACRKIAGENGGVLRVRKYIE